MFRLVNENDHDLYMRLTYEFYYLTDGASAPIPDYYRENTWKELMRSDTRIICYIFEDDDLGVPYGYGLLNRTWSQEAGGELLNVEELYIVKEYRGTGKGVEFLNFMREEYPLTRRFRLDVVEGHDKVIDLYKKAGYEFLPYLQMTIDKKY